MHLCEVDTSLIFNSFEFIFLFLPIVFLGYFILSKVNFTYAKIWLFISSLFFYSWWNPIYLPLLLFSLVVNYIFGTTLGKMKYTLKKKVLLTMGILFNVCLLGYFKYYDFFITNINTVFDTDIRIM